MTLQKSFYEKFIEHYGQCLDVSDKIAKIRELGTSVQNDPALRNEELDEVLLGILKSAPQSDAALIKKEIDKVLDIKYPPGEVEESGDDLFDV